MTEASPTARDDDKSPKKIAYLMSRFPKLTETFILNEILAVRAEGETVEIFPLWREPADTVHPAAAALMDEVHFFPHMNLRMLRDNLLFALTRPRRYFTAFSKLMFYNARAPRFILGALAFFPKLPSMARDMERLGIDHIHAHFANHPAAAAYGLSILTDLEYSFTAHGSDLHRRQTMLREKVRAARFVVTISRYNVDFMARYVDPQDVDKIHIVHCGVDTDRFSSGSKSGNFSIVCAGSLQPLKGQRHLIKACAKLEGIDWCCNLVGHGPELASLKSLVRRLDVSERVIFHGPCASEQVARLMSEANVACTPSSPTPDGRREGLPVVLMEAAACSLPLVSTRMSGIPEIVRDGYNGFLTEPGDVDAIAKALSDLAKDPDLAAEMGKRSREIAEKEFSLQKNAAALNALFHEATEC